MDHDILQVADINLDTIQLELHTLQNQLEELAYHQQLTNTIILYVVGITAAVGVCLLLYHFIKLFFI